MFPRSACLPARLWGRWRSHLIRADVLRCPACRPSARLVPRLVHHPVCRVGSSRLAPSCDTMGGEASGCGCAIRLSPPVSFPVLAYLGSFLAIHLMRMAAAVCDLSARRALLACLVVSVPPLVARSFPFMGRSIGAALCRCPDVVGMGSGGHDMLCIIPSSPIVCDCLRRAD